jgi:uncharacterized protein (DUF433 family)
MAVAHPKRDLFGGRKPADVPRYTLPEAAHHLRLPTNTIRAWVVGRSYLAAGDTKRSRPIIAPADPRLMLLSFGNLAELYILKAIRHFHRIKLPRIRRAVEYLQQRLGSRHPLLEQKLLADGRHIFVDQFGSLVSASEGGQMVFEWMGLHLDRIERDASGLPIRLFPFTRDARASSPRLVSIDPRIGFGRPCITGTDIPTAIIAERHEAGDSVTELADDYGRSRGEIEEAIRYESRRAA